MLGSQSSGHNPDPERESKMHDHTTTPWWRTKVGVAVIGFCLVAAFYVLREHYAHAFGALPYLLLLACPLMHLFMHHGHDGHEGHSARGWQAEPRMGHDKPQKNV